MFTSTFSVAHMPANGCVGVLRAPGAVAYRVRAWPSLGPAALAQLKALSPPPCSHSQPCSPSVSGQVRWLSVPRISFKLRPSPRGPWHGVVLRIRSVCEFARGLRRCVCGLCCRVVALLWRARQQSARRQRAVANWVRLARGFRRLRRRKRLWAALGQHLHLCTLSGASGVSRAAARTGSHDIARGPGDA